MIVKTLQIDEPRTAPLRRKPAGFTLLELMVSLLILGILSAIAYPLSTQYLEKARIIAAIADIHSISEAIAAYHIEHSGYPATLNDIGYGTFLDPWRNPYRYLNIQTAPNRGVMRKDRFLVPINSDYDLYSMGKDGRSSAPLTAQASRDDVIRANDGNFLGLASDY